MCLWLHCRTLCCIWTWPPSSSCSAVLTWIWRIFGSWLHSSSCSAVLTWIWRIFGSWPHSSSCSAVLMLPRPTTQYLRVKNYIQDLPNVKSHEVFGIRFSPPRKALSRVHPQNVRFQNVRFQNVRFQNVWNVRFTKRQVCKTSGLQNVRFTKRQVFKTFGWKKTSIYILYLWLVEIRRFCCSHVCRQSDGCVLFFIL